MSPKRDLLFFHSERGGSPNLWSVEVTDLLRKVHFQRGDANADGQTNISDAIAILNSLFLGSAGRVSCGKSADLDDNGTLGSEDGLMLFAHLFQGALPPLEPSLACGADPTSDSLSCEQFAPCRPGVRALYSVHPSRYGRWEDSVIPAAELRYS